jgi:hypothetical protein
MIPVWYLGASESKKQNGPTMFCKFMRQYGESKADLPGEIRTPSATPKKIEADVRAFLVEPVTSIDVS